MNYKQNLLAGYTLIPCGELQIDIVWADYTLIPFVVKYKVNPCVVNYILFPFVEDYKRIPFVADYKGGPFAKDYNIISLCAD